MPELNLPPCQLKTISQDDGRLSVWDPVRQKYVALTPEENVRQHFVSYLVTRKSYPLTHLMNEVTLNLNGLSRRCDTVAYDRQLTPKAIIEYKAPHIGITKKVFDQITRYNLTLKVDYLIVSNGLKHYCVKMNYADGSYTFQTGIPAYTEL
ncbi:MAG: type I restriction enzyme HsdR N-terminal domain-containing protein [Bacteroidaceae bacterium]|nr:type I restriction enzyme HsdR N-terminal domain-containing protein [Bacteroidaceae bacterium]